VACGATVVVSVSVSLPPFSEEMAEFALRVEGSNVPREWFAYAPLWLYERDEAAEGDVWWRWWSQTSFL
jgi:hypothetical protein